MSPGPFLGFAILGVWHLSITVVGLPDKAIAEAHGREATIIGRVSTENPDTVSIPEHRLIWEGKVFRKVG